eukprot:jgi/Psemu1/291431/fgenesh1_pg.697_\
MPYGYGFETIRWAPRVHDAMPAEKYYELDRDVVMVPFHAMAADNPGHLVWDNFLPLYNLLGIFGLDRNQHNSNSNSKNNNDFFRHLLIRVDTLPPLSATCDLRPKKKEACKRSFQKFLPLMGVVAGMGWLSDHGIRESHGWMMNREKHSLDVALAQNVGRGPQLYAFRNFVLRNMGLEPFPSSTITAGDAATQPPITFRIVLNAHSSTYLDRSFGLEEQREALSKAFPATTDGSVSTSISTVTLADLPLREQLELISQPTRPNEHIIFVSANGGGTMTAFFLPRGSSMILYYNERGGRDYFSNGKNTGGQAMLDWDLMNNLGYVRTHWLPIGSMNEPEGLDALVQLVRHEMDVTRNGM